MSFLRKFRFVIFVLVLAATWFALPASQSSAATATYANNGQYWLGSASMYTTTGGYCGHAVTWCSPNYFRWGELYQTLEGTWDILSPGKSASVSFYIPSTHAVALARYKLDYQTGSIGGTYTCSINQWEYYNDFAPCVSSLYNPNKLKLFTVHACCAQTDDIAWDEARVVY